MAKKTTQKSQSKQAKQKAKLLEETNDFLKQNSSKKTKKLNYNAETMEMIHEVKGMMNSDHMSDEDFMQMVIHKKVESDAAFWAGDAGKVNLGHSTFSFERHEYQRAMMEEDFPRQVFIKGAQMGVSEIQVLKTLHGMIFNRYPKGVLYLFPTGDDCTEFTKSRFNPLIEHNPFIKAHVVNTDSATIKRINKAFLFMRGARATKEIGSGKKSATKLKAIPVDRIVFDERDEMENSMVDLAKERVSHSDVKEEIFLSTPTLPDYGVDAMYKESDQRIWCIKCEHCGKYTCLELEFPTCIQFDAAGKAYRACKKCKKEIYPSKGVWVPQYPQRSKDLVGWWISQLNSTYIDPGEILRLYRNPPNGNIGEIMNSKLGMAYVAAENRLNQNEIWAKVGRDLMDTEHDGPACMGIDVGRILHVVIGVKPNDNLLKIVKVARVSSFNDVYDLAKKFNVKCAVFDLFPETRRVREFQHAANFEVFGCQYMESQRGQAFWDEKDGRVKINRNEILDATHNLVVEPGGLELPRPNAEIEKFVDEMCNVAKVLNTNDETGHREYKYIKVGQKGDHYRHALNYCYLASDRIGLVTNNNFLWGLLNRQKSSGRTWMTM